MKSKIANIRRYKKFSLFIFTVSSNYFQCEKFEEDLLTISLSVIHIVVWNGNCYMALRLVSPDDTSIIGLKTFRHEEVFSHWNIQSLMVLINIYFIWKKFRSAPHQIKDIGHYRHWKATTGATIKSVVPVYRF